VLKNIVRSSEHEEIVKVQGSDGRFVSSRHRIVDRKLRVKPDMLIIGDRIYYDYTAIIMAAWETGQEVLIRKG
jgi:hypothetical protein